MSTLSLRLVVFLLLVLQIHSYGIRKHTIPENLKAEQVDSYLRNSVRDYLARFGLDTVELERFEKSRIKLRKNYEQEMSRLRWPSYYEFVSLRKRHPESNLFSHPFLTIEEVLTVYSDILHEYYFYKVRFSKSNSKVRKTFLGIMQKAMQLLASKNLKVLVKNVRTGAGIQDDIVKTRPFLELLALEIIVQRKLAQMESFLRSVLSWEEGAQKGVNLFNKESWKMPDPDLKSVSRDVFIWVKKKRYVYDFPLRLQTKEWKFLDRFFLPMDVPLNQGELANHIEKNSSWRSRLEESRKKHYSLLELQDKWQKREKIYLEMSLDDEQDKHAYFLSFEPELRQLLKEELDSLGLNSAELERISTSFARTKEQHNENEVIQWGLNSAFVKPGPKRTSAQSNPGYLRSEVLDNLDLARLYSNYCKKYFSVLYLEKNPGLQSLIKDLQGQFVQSNKIEEQLEEQEFSWKDDDSREEFLNLCLLSIVVQWKVASFYEFLETIDWVFKENFFASLDLQKKLKLLGDSFYLSLKEGEREQLREELRLPALVQYHQDFYELDFPVPSRLRDKIDSLVLPVGIPQNLMDLSRHLDGQKKWKELLIQTRVN